MTPGEIDLQEYQRRFDCFLCRLLRQPAHVSVSDMRQTEHCLGCFQILAGVA